MLKLKGISKAFGHNHVLRDVSLTVDSEEIVGFIGPSGSGKSVLMKIIGGVTAADSGEVVRDNEGAVGLLFQEGALFDSMSVIENVAFPLVEERRCCRDEIYERSYEILSEVGLAKAARKMPGELSGGMRRRVGIARALVHRPSLLLMDDPTGGLDPVAASVIMNLIVELRERHRSTLLIVSHDLRRLLPKVSRVVAMFNGEIRADFQMTNNLSRIGLDDELLHFISTRYALEPFSGGIN